MWNLPAGPTEPSIAAVEKFLPLLDQLRSLLGDAEYRRRRETHVHWTRLAA
jgi:hypothetical protein